MTIQVLEPSSGWPGRQTPITAAGVLNAIDDFGAKGDGVTNDTAALQAWLDAGSTGTFYEYPLMVLPRGSYLITAPLSFIPTTPGATLALRGAGSYSSAILLSGSNFGPTAPAFQIGDATHTVRCDISGVIINGNHASAQAGTVACTLGDPNIVGTGTSFTAAMVGKLIVIGGYPYQLASVTNTTHAALTQNFFQATDSYTYIVAQGDNGTIGQSFGWDVYSAGQGFYRDFGAWYCDTGFKLETSNGGEYYYGPAFNQCNISYDGNLTVGTLMDGISFFGGYSSFAFKHYDFTDLGNFLTNLNWYGVFHAAPSYGGRIWDLKNVFGFGIHGCHVDIGETIQSGVLGEFGNCTAGDIFGNFFAKGGTTAIPGFLQFVTSTDCDISANHFRAAVATDNAITFDVNSLRNHVGPNAGFRAPFDSPVAFTTPIVDSNTAVGRDANTYDHSIQAPTIPTFANNAAAVAGGLEAGDLYTTGVGDPCPTYVVT